ncbi:Hypothetical protein PHPALM_11588 [Phytophthora palmivora]|uniref:Uncharacterized protein n=1 Tax=Phytophthora palmivora TaxID=4796 RepID=A0A2P4Y1W6_9STRA|nr:Hypothetical protein PHPALM_11588 [Phytophthora palmivora]
MTAGAFDPDDGFDLDLKVIQIATQDLFSKLKILVGAIPPITDPVPSPSASITDRLTFSSHYASAAEDKSYLSSYRWDCLVPLCWSRDDARSSVGIQQDPSRPLTARSRRLIGDDIDFPTVARAIATATTGSVGSAMIQSVRISAISDLKDSRGKIRMKIQLERGSAK